MSKCGYWLLTAIVCVAVCAAVGQVQGQEKETAPKDVTIKGVVSVTRNDDWAVVSATLKETGKADVYKIKLDAKGKALAEEWEDEEMEVTGTVTKEKDEKWLTVKSFKPVPKEAAPEPAPEPGEWE
ncbi:MAG: hypothetical protein JXR37_13165 [Kiritimatiellae bacterium]|nr:hypothetical protein [Kiritimatiellia bacterium]